MIAAYDMVTAKQQFSDLLSVTFMEFNIDVTKHAHKPLQLAFCFGNGHAQLTVWIAAIASVSLLLTLRRITE